MFIDSFYFVPVHSLSVLGVGITERHRVVRIVASEEQPENIQMLQRCQIHPIKSVH